MVAAMSKSRDTIPLGLNAVHDRLTEARSILGDAPGEDTFADTTLKTARITLDGLKRAILEKQVDDMDDMRVTVRLPASLFQKPPASDE